MTTSDKKYNCAVIHTKNELKLPDLNASQNNVSIGIFIRSFRYIFENNVHLILC